MSAHELPARSRSEARAAERAAERGDAPGQAAPDHDDRPHRPRRLTVVLVLASALLLVWAGACFVDSGQPILVALTALAPLISVLALPVLAVAVAGRQIVPAVVTIAAAVVPWGLVAGSAVAGPGPTSASGHRTLNIMTVDAAGSASAASIVRTTRTFGVHTLVVTGLTNTLAHDLTVAGLNSVLTPRWVGIPADGTSGAGLWSISPITATRPVPGFGQPSVVTTLSTPSGPISLLAAYAGGSSVIPDSGWRNDLKALARATPDGPRVLAGDLGGTPWHPAFRSLQSSGWHEAADVLGRGLRPTWPSWGPVPFSPLDQVLVGGGVGVSTADTITIAGTSHRALLVTLVLPGTKTSTPDT